ncbi:MAG: hypothetical protein GY745_20455 [Actinomycetia bacterium]|nr:hypothetical protein [Actinomycetes bacterium]
MEVELEEHLGDDEHAPWGRNGANSGNGTRSKTVITEVGPVEIVTPRDRDGTSEPKTVRKRQRRLRGVDSMVISSTAKGLMTAVRFRPISPRPSRAPMSRGRRSRRSPTGSSTTSPVGPTGHRIGSTRWCSSTPSW